MNCNFKEMAVVQASREPDFEGKLLYIPPPKQQSSTGTTSANVFALGKAMAGKAASRISGTVAKPSDNNARTYWFKLRANLLFYFKDFDKSPGSEVEPSGFMVMEEFQLQREDQLDPQSSTFSIIFKDCPFKRHTFTAFDKLDAYNWETNLRNASFLGLEHRVKELQVNHLKTDKIRLRSFRNSTLLIFLLVNLFLSLLQARLGRKLEQDPLHLSDGDSVDIVTSKLLTSSTKQIESLSLLDPPVPLRRKKKGEVSPPETQRKGLVVHSHEETQLSEAIKQSSKPFRNSTPTLSSNKPTFKVHVSSDGVAVGNLLDL